MTELSRSYTLRLFGEGAWNHRLLDTHLAVQQGVCRVLDTFLSLRAALDPAVIDRLDVAMPAQESRGGASARTATAAAAASSPAGGGGKRRGRKPSVPAAPSLETLDQPDPQDQRRRWMRRILVATWFTVEDENDLNRGLIIAPDQVAPRLADHLALVGIHDSWWDEVADILEGSRRAGRVLVDRRRGSQQLAQRWGMAIDQELWEDSLGRFLSLGDAFVPTTAEASRTMDCSQLAGSLLSARFGTGKKSDQGAIARGYLAVGAWARGCSTGFPDAASAEEDLMRHLRGQGLAIAGMADVHALVSRPKVGGFGQFDTWQAKGQPITPEMLASLGTSCELNAGKAAGKVGVTGPRPWSDALRVEVEEALGIPYQDEVRGRSNREFFCVAFDLAARRILGHQAAIRQSLHLRDLAQETAAGMARIPEPSRLTLDAVYEVMRERYARNPEDTYTLRTRAIAGIHDLVEAWKRLGSAAERVAAISLVGEDLAAQDKPFGDRALFEVLAEDRFTPAWQDPEDGATGRWLVLYQEARQAQEEQRSYLHPSIRFPHAYLAPAWIDYGASRPGVEFQAREAIDRLPRLQEKRAEILAKQAEQGAKRKHAKRDNAARAADAGGEGAGAAAGDGAPSDGAAGAASQDPLSQRLQKIEAEIASLSQVHNLSLETVSGGTIRSLDLRWANKRFEQDIGLAHPEEKKAPPGWAYVEEPGAPTTSATGIAPAVEHLSRADLRGKVAAGLPATALAAPANPWKENWSGRLQMPRRELKAFFLWCVKHGIDAERPATWPSKAQARFAAIPWYLSHGMKMEIAGPWHRYCTAAHLNPDYWPHQELNRGREPRRRLMLARLPAGLRVAAVNLGIRQPATVAIGRTMRQAELLKICADAGIQAPQEDQVTIAVTDGEGRRQVYHRLASPQLADGTEHPSPWMLEERVVPIEATGDHPDDERRLVPGAETELLQNLAAAAEVTLPAWSKAPRVGTAQQALLVGLRHALRRHNDLAMVIWNLTQPSTPTRAVGLESLGAMCLGRGGTSERLCRAWTSLLRFPLPLPLPKELTRAQRKEEIARRREDMALRATQVTTSEWSALLAVLGDIWKEADGAPAEQGQPATGWHRILRQLRDWILPLGANRGAVRGWLRHHMGGLSLERIDRYRALWSLNRSHHQRVIPAVGPVRLRRGVDPAWGDRMAESTRSLVEMREKEITARIFNVVLGIHYHVDAPAMALVVSDYSALKPASTRLRRKNRLITKMAASNLTKRLEEGAQVLGIHLRTISPSYIHRWSPFHARPVLPVRRMTLDDVKYGLVAKRIEVLRRKMEETKLAWADVPVADRLLLLGREILQRSPGAAIYIKEDHGPIGLVEPGEDGRIITVNIDRISCTNLLLNALRDPDDALSWWRAPVAAGAGARSGHWAFPDLLRILGPAPESPATSKIVNYWRCPMGWKPTTEYWAEVSLRTLSAVERSLKTPVPTPGVPA